MNLLVLTCLLCSAVCSSLATQGSEATVPSKPTVDTGSPAGLGSADDLQTLQDDDDALEVFEDHSGGEKHGVALLGVHPGREERRRKRGKGKGRSKGKGRTTTPLNPEHSFSTSGYTSTLSTTHDPCTSSHLGYCIHGYCKHIEGLLEPVCICMKGYDGERCGIQTLETVNPQSKSSGNGEVTQMVLVIVAVVLSVISCLAILLMSCAHYRSHKNILASYLGSAAEQEKLQKPAADVVV